MTLRRNERNDSITRLGLRYDYGAADGPKPKAGDKIERWTDGRAAEVTEVLHYFYGTNYNLRWLDEPGGTFSRTDSYLWSEGWRLL